MNITDSKKYIARINKLSNGNSVDIPGFGRVTAYQRANGKYGSRKFSVSGSYVTRNGGNHTFNSLSTALKALAR